jgi:hypothetical protein
VNDNLEDYAKKPRKGGSNRRGNGKNSKDEGD